MIEYSRFVADGAIGSVEDVTEQIREHLSACADPNDDPRTLAGRVEIERRTVGDGTLITGRLSAQPDAPYLRPHYDPAADDDGHRFAVWVPEDEQ